MSAVDALLIGAVGSAFAIALSIGVTIAIKKTWMLVKSLTEALKEIPKLREANQQLVVIGKQVGEEVMYLRQIMSASVQTEESGYQPPVQPPMVGRVPAFPTPDFSRFKVQAPIPDATVDDTDMGALTQDDAELTELDRLETLRQMGLEVHDEEEEPTQ